LFYYAEDSQTNQYVRKRTYGGKLVENAVQALSRDVLAHGILNLERAGFPVLMTIHDENIVSIKHEIQLDEVSKIMCQLPAWAKGFPVAAEGFVCSRYRKG
jgi:DNA polymerase